MKRVHDAGGNIATVSAQLAPDTQAALIAQEAHEITELKKMMETLVSKI